MGFITNQWLNRGQGLRNRKYSPVSVTIKAEVPTDSWSRDHQVCAEFTARRANCEYQTLHLTLEDIEPVTKTLISVCPSQSRPRLALDLLQGLSDTDLLRVLERDLRARVKNVTDR